ncbi:MAG: bifunctional riboflavin kinase/FAD synthetase [Bacteroidota bacterium]|nr:bifunctional riboflavin kinase/FAD synthetase [Bacteroidota bacterium]
MRIHTDLDNLNFRNPAVTMGAFDGIHLGHQKIINRVIEKSKELNGESVIITFYPHPKVFLNPQDPFKTILTHLDKIDRFYHHKIDHLVVLNFNEELSQMSGEDYVENILVKKIKMAHLVMGHDHCFGNNKLCSIDKINVLGEKYNFTTEQVGAQTINNQVISSSIIRDRLSTGNIEEANKFLGYNYFVFGRVVHGNQIGKTIGFPTANIEIKKPHKKLPCNGVYIVKINWNGNIYNGICNLGIRPTIRKSKFTFEVHIFDFHRDIYQDYLTVSFIDRIRDEKRFNSLEALKQQLSVDKKVALEYFQSHPEI